MSYKTSGSCPRKAQARKDTILIPYQELFQKSLPIKKQYWTLAGPCYDDTGSLGTNSEIWQLTASGLISANQYHGIDNSLEIIKNNRKAVRTGNFYYGDFVTQLQIASEQDDFDPGIIHADFTRMKETSTNDIGNIVHLVDNSNVSDTMIVMNFPWNNPYKGKNKTEVNPDDVLNLLQSNQRFNASWSDRWSIYPKCYSYGGTGKSSKTTMATFILYKN